MTLSTGESLVIIFVCAACTQFERFLPFLIFGGRPVPPVVRYLGRILPMAVIATLTVYCLRDVSFASAGGFVPQLIAVAVTAGLHLWKRQSLLSIFGGTACYMLLVQVVFA
jgi:branched-subunit amino acid transport protein AzlD